MNINENTSNTELLNQYNAQVSVSTSMSMLYTEHDDRHWDRDEYDDYDFDGNSTTNGGHADNHSDSWHYDD